ncbi:MAG: hypothetical protein PHU07_01315 [Acidocella sp.]|nr:hypothetical protein [Acidocella sp.]
MNTHIPGRVSLLALPAALSLAAPALGQGVIGASQTNGVNLASYDPGPVSIVSGVSITSTGWAAVWGEQVAQLANAGVVRDDNGAGIYLGAGGGVTNTGIVSGVDAIHLNGAGSVANSGVIGATGYGVLVNNGAGSVTNTGQIAAGFDGVSLNHGGQVDNSGSIFGGHIGIYAGNGAGSISNSGVISARSGDAVSLYAGGNLTNTVSGRLLGGYSGVYAGGSGSVIQNAGNISAAEFGVYLTGASSVSNSGTIASGVVGVIGTGSGAVVENTGVISGGNTGVKLAGNAELTNSGTITGGVTGVRIGNNGTLTNLAGGLIQGGAVGLQAGTGDVIFNAGTILDNTQAGAVLGRGDVLVNTGSIGGVTGILTDGAVSIVNTGTITATGGGDAISFNSGVSTLTLGTGSVISGDIAGNGTASQINLTGTGMLDNDITGFNAGGALSVASGASWVGGGTWTIAQVTNSGTFTPGLLSAPLTINGNFTQTNGGTLRVAVTPAGIAPFTVNGTVRLAGTLVYVLAPGSYSPATESFLTASGGVTGGFTTVSGDGQAPQIQPQTPPKSQPQVPVQSQTGTQPVVTIASSAAAPALVITQSFTVAPADATLVPNMSQAMALGAQTGSLALLDHAATGSQAACQSPVAHSPDATANAAAALASGFCAVGGWVQASGAAISADGAYNLRGGGFLGGVDRPVYTGGRLGVAAGYDTMNMKDKSGSRAEMDTVRIGLYASQPIGRVMLSADVMDSIASTNSTRQTGAGGAIAKGNANIISGAVQVASTLSFQGASITPAFGIIVDSVNMGSLSETASTQAFAVNAGGSGGVTVAPYLRLSVAKTFITASSLAITPAVSLGVTDSLSNPGNRVTLTAQDGTSFIVSPHHLAPLSGQVAANLVISRGSWSFAVGYSANLAGNWTAQAVQAGVAARF